MTHFAVFRIVFALGLFALAGCQMGSSAYETYLGKKAESAGRIDEAILHYSAAIDHAPGVGESYITRGSAYSLKGDYGRALADFSRAIELVPGNSVYHFNRGNALIGLKRHEEAIAEFGRAIELAPASIGAIRRRGLVFFLVSRYPEARADFEQVLGLNPEDEFAPVWLYLVAARGGNPDRALLAGPLEAEKVGGWARQVYELFLEKASPEAFEESIRENKAREIYDLDERLSEGRFYIGEYHLIRGEKEKARRAFLKSTDTGPLGIYEFLASQAELTRLNPTAKP